MQPTKEKRLDFEALRLLAIFCVVFNHTQKRGFDLYMAEGVSRVNYASSLLLGILCKVAVPLFFLVSGGLLLHREEQIRVVLRKRVLRILTVLVLFSGVLYLFWIRWGYTDGSGFEFLSRIWSQGISIPYWYLYAYLGILLMLPLLRTMVGAMSDMMFVYLAALHVTVYGVLGTVAFSLNLGPMNPDFLLPVIEPCLFYFLMGYFLVHRFSWDLMERRHMVFAWILAVLSVAAMYVLADISVKRKGTVDIDYQHSLMVFPVFAVYAWIHRLFAGRTVPAWIRRGLSALGGCVFGAYLLEGILRNELDFVYQWLEPRIHVLPACLVWVTAVVLCGLFITWVLKRIPVIRKLL